MRNYFNQAKLMDYHLHWSDLESVIQLISFAGLSAMINAVASQTIAIDSLMNVLAKKKNWRRKVSAALALKSQYKCGNFRCQNLIRKKDRGETKKKKMSRCKNT